MSFVLKLRTIFINKFALVNLKKRRIMFYKKIVTTYRIIHIRNPFFCKENYCKKCETKTVVFIKKYNQKGSISYNEKNPCTSSHLYSFLSNY